MQIHEPPLKTALIGVKYIIGVSKADAKYVLDNEFRVINKVIDYRCEFMTANFA